MPPGLQQQGRDKPPSRRILKRSYYGWAIVAVLFLFSITEIAVYNPVLSVFVRPMAEEFGWSRTLISGAVTAGTFGGAIVAFIAGPIMDRYGTRVVLLLAAVIMGGSLMSMSRMNSEVEFYFYYMICRSLGAGITTLAASTAVSNWFITKRGRALGITQTGSRLGIGLLPALAQFQIIAFGWRQAWLTLGLMVWATGIIPIALFIKRRPEDIGLLPDGVEGSPVQPHQAVKSAAANPPPEPAWLLREAVRTRALWLLAGAAAATQLVMSGVNLHMVPHMIDLGNSPGMAVTALGIFALAAAGGGIGWGLMAERVSVQRCLAVDLAVSAFGVLLLMVASHPLMTYVFAVVYGLAFGGMSTLVYTAWADFFGRVSLGTIRGFTTPMALLANGIGPLIGGWFYDMTGGYNEALLIYIATLLLGALLALLARKPLYRSPSLARTS
ncbi:MAG: MFS transporter [Chloroflexota bacterium]